MPGVKSVITSQDLAEFDQQALTTDDGLLGRYFSSSISAREKVLYQGHPIAAVAAVNPHVAEEAIGLIAVEYELLEPVLDVRSAMQPDAPVLLEFLRGDQFGIKKEQPGNIASHMRLELGDIQKGFAEADVIIEREFETQMVHQGYIEPQTATALYLEDGQITLWTSTQDPFGVRDQVADILDLPVKRLHIIPMEVGGGFGGKNRVFLEPLVVLLSKKSGSRPVKMTMSRAEVLAATGPTSGSFMKVKMGAKHNGQITAAQATLVYEAGAFPGSSVGSGAGIMFSPYRIENLCVDGYDVVVNKPFTSTYRAPGATNANFAAETVVDELCQKLNLDPMGFREINAAQEGDRNIYGYKLGKVGNVETIAAAKSHPHYTAPDLIVPGKLIGRGIASGFWGNYGGKSSASASVNPDGSISLVTGSVDLSGTRTSLGMQLAEAMGIPLEQVNVRVADTNSVGYTEGSYGSRTTFATGWATYEVGSRLH